MDLNTARAIVWTMRLVAFGPSALSEPNAQAAIDAYAGPMSSDSNAEAHLTDLFNAMQNDGRTHHFLLNNPQ